MVHNTRKIAISAVLLLLAAALGSGDGWSAADPARAPPGPAGWYIDDVTVVADTLHTVLKEDFEAGAQGWTHGGVNDSWEIGVPTNPAGPGAANGGSECAATNLSGPYKQRSVCWLESPDFDLSMAFSSELNFYEWFDVAPSDSLYVSVVSLIGGTMQESDPVEITGIQQYWGARNVELGSLTLNGNPMPVVGSDRVQIKFTLVSGAYPRLAAQAGNGCILLNWTPPVQPGPPVISYNVYRGASHDSLGLYIQPGNVTDYNDSAVTNGQTYYYSVAAVSSSGEGSMSNTAGATPGAPPGPPENLTVTKGNLLLGLAWEAPADDGGFGIQAYVVYRAEGTGPALTWLCRLGNTTHLDDKEVTNGTMYVYAVSAVNRMGEGPQSLVAGGSPGKAPSPPLGLNASGRENTIRLAWRQPEDADVCTVMEYIVHRWNVSGPELRFHNGIRLMREEQLGHSEKQIFYDVTAVNDFGESDPTPTVSLGCPSAPTSPEVTVGAKGMALGWKAPDSDGGCDLDHYNVYRYVNGSEPELVWSTPDSLTNCTCPVVENSTACAYYVTAVNAVGESDPSPSVSPSPDRYLPQITITSPLPGALLNRSSIDFTGTASDQAGLAKVEISVDGHDWWRCAGLASWRATLLLDEGTSHIVVRATDIVGNANSTSVDVIVDLSPPAVWFTGPPDGSVLLSDTVNVSGRASDVSSVSRVELSAGGTIWYPATGAGNWTGSLRLGPGANALYARATDAAGNVNTTGMTVSLDTHDPLIIISSPFDNRSFMPGQTIFVEGEASDDIGVRQVEVRLDMGPWSAVNGTGAWICNLTAGPGNHMIWARATDLADREAVAGVNITVERAVPPAEVSPLARTSNDLMLPAIAVLAALAVVVAVVILRRRGKRRAFGE